MPDAIFDAFRKVLQKKIEESRVRNHFTNPANDNHFFVHHKRGRKYDKFDVGDSGKYLVEVETGLLFLISGYGKTDRRRCLGNIMELANNPDAWWYDGYSIANDGVTTRNGWAGPIDIPNSDE